jgi:DNA-directed RNA polymerase specialized sigma subunit
MRVPRRLKDLQSSINSTVSQLSQELNRAPAPSEIAARLGISAEEVVEGLDAQQAYRSTSLDELVSGADTSLADTLGTADAELDKVEYRQTLAPLLDELPERGADDPRAALLRQHDPDPDRGPGGDLADARLAAARADRRGPAAQDAQ